jgi:hypothetical protein
MRIGKSSGKRLLQTGIAILLVALFLFLPLQPAMAAGSGSVSVRVNIGTCISLSENGSVTSNVTTVTINSGSYRTVLPR